MRKESIFRNRRTPGCCGRFMEAALSQIGVAPASCRHVCRAKNSGRDVRPEAGETPALPARALAETMRKESIFRNRRTPGCCGRFYGSCALANRRSAGILPACLPRQKGGRDVRRKAGETPALPASVSHSYCIPRDAATRFWYSRALAMAAASSTVSSFRLRMTTRPPMITVSTSLALSAYASCA
jgi:hypothetical protein